jgi:glycosyltransferase involved in cell wall biosynthesis
LKVLYLSHTSVVSGAERSLLDLLAALPDEISATVACPEGRLAEAVRSLGLPVARVEGTAGSLKLHPWHTARGLVDIGRTAWAVRRLATRHSADLIHANSVRAGLAAVFAARAGGPPVVVHVHDSLPPSPVSSLVLNQIGRHAAVVICNSRHTRDSFRRVHSAGSLRVVHAGVDVNRFDPRRVGSSNPRDRLGVEPSTFLLAVIAQITPWKGQDDAIRALGLLKPSQPQARLLVVGSPKFVGGATRYDNRAYAETLLRLTESLDLVDDVVFLGERDDIPAILQAVDVLLVPSWEEPFGLALLEAMAMQVPVVATNVGGPVEIVRDGEEGLLVSPRVPKAWAAAIENLIRDPERRAAMGRKAREHVAERFSVDRYVRGVLGAYEEALGEHTRRRVSGSTR